MFDSRKLTRPLIEPLRTFRRKAPSSQALIAGGAVRDTLAGRPIRDIDIFYWHYNYSLGTGGRTQDHTWEGQKAGYDSACMFQDWFNVGVHTIGNAWSTGPGSENYMGGNVGIHLMQIDECWLGGVKFQFIGTKIPPLQYVKEHFDIDFCRAWCDGSKMSVATPFINDWHNNTMTVTGKLTKDEWYYALRYHVPRLQQKYPDRRVVLDPAMVAKYGS